MNGESSDVGIVNLLETKNEEKKPYDVKEISSSLLSLSDLNSLYTKHVSHICILKDNDMLTKEKKREILRNIEEVYSLITKTHSNSKRNRDDDDETDITVTNCNSNVSWFYFVMYSCIMICYMP